MARTVKSPDERSSELIATAQYLFYTKGYECTSVSDIVKAAGVAQGTFYYHFDSKLAVLEAMVEVLAGQAQLVLEEIVADESLAAIPKWQKAFRSVGNWKIQRKKEGLEAARLLLSEGNVLLQHKMQAKWGEVISRELAHIIAQGIEEGVFAPQPVQESAEMIYAINVTCSTSFVDLVLNADKHDNPIALAKQRLAATQAAIERLLGAPVGSLPILDEKAIEAWFAG